MERCSINCHGLRSKVLNNQKRLFNHLSQNLLPLFGLAFGSNQRPINGPFVSTLSHPPNHLHTDAPTHTDAYTHTEAHTHQLSLKIAETKRQRQIFFPTKLRKPQTIPIFLLSQKNVPTPSSLLCLQLLLLFFSRTKWRSTPFPSLFSPPPSFCFTLRKSLLSSWLRKCKTERKKLNCPF